MAGHLPIKTNKNIEKLIRNFQKEKPTSKTFEEFSCGRGRIARLSNDYFMNDWHGLKDSEVICIAFSERSFEVHLDKDNNINQIYMVL